MHSGDIAGAEGIFVHQFVSVFVLMTDIVDMYPLSARGYTEALFGAVLVSGMAIVIMAIADTLTTAGGIAATDIRVTDTGFGFEA